MSFAVFLNGQNLLQVSEMTNLIVSVVLIRGERRPPRVTLMNSLCAEQTRDADSVKSDKHANSLVQGPPALDELLLKRDEVDPFGYRCGCRISKTEKPQLPLYVVL